MDKIEASQTLLLEERLHQPPRPEIIKDIQEELRFLRGQVYQMQQQCIHILARNNSIQIPRRQSWLRRNLKSLLK
jgi:hypothetical protein